MTDQDALKVAREFVVSQESCRGISIMDLAALIQRERAAAVEALMQPCATCGHPERYHDRIEDDDTHACLMCASDARCKLAVEAARPEIERAARVKALEWALSKLDGVNDDEVEAELARLQAGQDKERDAGA